MIPPHRVHFQREFQHVQQYIQARLQTEEPGLLSVNAAQMDEYYDEVQNYVKQKQRQSQVRRPLSTNQGPPTSSHSFSHPSPVAVQPPPTSAKSFSHPSPVATPAPPTSAKSFSHGNDRSSPRPGGNSKLSLAYPEPRAPPSPSVVPFRLPGIQWLLGSSRVKSEPVAAGPCMQALHSPGVDALHSNRFLKKQKTM